MRNIPSEVVSLINTQYGLESILIVRLWYSSTNYIDYTEETVDGEDVQARILSLSGLEDVQDLSGKTSSSSISVSLDDTDGALKTIINNFDIHKIRAQVLQWFKGISKTKAFVIFDGEVNSPIVWSEANRSLSFTILSPLENREFGFSADEGQFDFLPESIVGKAWPVVFGTVLQVPSLQVIEAPSVIIGQGFSRVYDEVWQAEMDALIKSRDQAHTNMLFSFSQGYTAETTSSLYRDGFDNDFSPPDDPDTAAQYHSSAQQYFAQAGSYQVEMLNIEGQITALQDEWDEKRAFAHTSIPVISPDIPRGIEYTAEIGGTIFRVRVDGTQLNIIAEIDPPDEPVTTYLYEINFKSVSTVYKGQKSKEKFKWFNAGTRVRLLDFPLQYVAALGNAQIVNVYGLQQGIKVKVDPALYSTQIKSFTNDTTTMRAAIITFPKALSSFKDLFNAEIWDSDEIFCDVNGEVNGTFVDIVSWTVQNFTNLTAPPGPNWDDVKALTIDIPMNFAVLDRMNAVDFIKNLAFQVKCAAYINDRQLWLKYLPKRETPIGTIGLGDIDEDSLEIFCSDTEELTTKFVAEWKFLLSDTKQNKVIFRYNVGRYGIFEQSFNYFALNTVASVEWSARYWIIRKANVWKKIRFRTFIHNLKYEPFDPVLINLTGGLVSNSPVVGVVEQATYNPTNNTIDMVVWLPIRWGEMNEYIWGYPEGVTELYPHADDPRLKTDNPFNKVIDREVFSFKPIFLTTVRGSLGPYFPTSVDKAPPASSTTINTALTEVPINYNRPPNMATVNQYDRIVISDPKSFPVTLPADGGGGLMGEVVAQISGDVYAVSLIGGTAPIEVTQRAIDLTGPPIPNGTPVIVIKKGSKYYMQSPTWQ